MTILLKKSALHRASMYVMALFYFLAGCYHFIHPGFYMKFMPGWVPLPAEMIILSGFFEILFALLLLIKQTRAAAAWGIIALLIAIFPANIKLAMDFQHSGHPYFWLAIVRLPVQLVLIWWAYSFTVASLTAGASSKGRRV